MANATRPKGPAEPSSRFPCPYDEKVEEKIPPSFVLLRKDMGEFERIISFVTAIQKACLGGPNADSGSISSVNGDKRAIETLVTDVEYIQNFIQKGIQKDIRKDIQKDNGPLSDNGPLGDNGPLVFEDSDNGNRADVLLHYLIEASKRKIEDFTGEEVKVNRKKLLQIIAKLKLWVPPQRTGDYSVASVLDAKTKQLKKKQQLKQQLPFISSKETENAATEIVKELVGLRCKQWGLDGLGTSYDSLSDTVKNCLLCFSAFKCDVVKDTDGAGVLIQKSLKIKKMILIHWWVAEGFIDLYRKENSSPNGNSPNQDDPTPKQEREKTLKTVEELGKEVLSTLVEKGFIEPVIKRGKESGSFKMHPFVHSFVSALAKRAGFFDFSHEDGQLTPSFRLSQRACLVRPKDKQSSCRMWARYTDDRNKLKRFGEVQTLFNVNESVIDIKREWFSRMKNLRVLHLGTWRSDPAEHIEVEDQKFMEDLKIMKQLRLLSMQGLSTIMQLNDSVCELTNLIILDLKDCHDLERLPIEIGSLKSLTHLDITNCHLLTKLPIGISLLSNLEVLKGFVIYDQASDQEVKKSCAWWRRTKGCLIHDVFRCKNEEVCTLKDLAKLKKLRKLTLVVNISNFPSSEEVQVFRDMRALESLRISWEKSFDKAGEDLKGAGESSKKCGGCFPCIRQTVVEDVSTTTKGLEAKGSLGHIRKLELWCFPKVEAPSWLHPNQLKNVEKLYIIGGNLAEIPGDPDKDKWASVKALRLKYLHDIKILWLDLRARFPNMTYLEKIDCQKLPFFPCDKEGVWKYSRETDNATAQSDNRERSEESAVRV